jgi:23S rRNA (adenine2503-C2)-methyltransferase
MIDLENTAADAATTDAATLTEISALLPEEICRLPVLKGQQPFRGAQIFSWIHDAKVYDFEQMTNISIDLRAELARSLTVFRRDPVEIQESSDGSKKLIFETPEGHQYSAVLMPSEERNTLCISSQIGCRMGCDFCMTAKVGFKRNLTAAEILGQIHAAAPLLTAPSRVSNVVFMGMGEPLDNYDEVLQAVKVMTHRKGLKVAHRRTTVSTVGLLDKIADFVNENTGASVAISLCATTDEARNKIVPAGRRYGIAELMNGLANMRLAHGHHFTIEYMLIKGVGDSATDARRLSALTSRFPSKINLIPFNPWPGCQFQRPSPEAIETFRSILNERNHTVTVRISRGQDIGAACGQLDGCKSGDKTL